jgi:hypothetical protein
VETLSLVLEDSVEESPAKEKSQQQEKQEKPEQGQGSARDQGSAGNAGGDLQTEQGQGMDEGGEGFEKTRMFNEEHETDDSFEAMPSSSDSSISE